MSSALRAALGSAIDYTACEGGGATIESGLYEYQRALTGPDAWALRRLVVPAAYLQDFEDAAGPFLYSQAVAGTWRLAVRAELGAARHTIPIICAFHEQLRRGRRERPVGVEAIEIAVDDPAEVHRIGMEVPHGFSLSIDLPIQCNWRPFVAAIAAVGARAIIQAGKAIDALHWPPEIVDALAACAARGVPVKLRIAGKNTAAQTRNDPWGSYVRLVLAASALRQRLGHSAVRVILGKTAGSGIESRAGTITCGHLSFSSAELNTTRRRVLDVLECRDLVGFRSERGARPPWAPASSHKADLDA